ncbi:hypothetical protein ACFV29_03875 [Streptomyces sp. NPDC059690]|uniref:hypothetical protein n=1 Tax=Streptomyces sp. NPDC059690 TaxID=3346907 RepID=UPI0036ACB677
MRGLNDTEIDRFASGVLCLRTGDRWRQAVSTALLGDWIAPLSEGNRLTADAIGALRAQARTIHRHLTPLWRRRTRHGRVLSLDADLGNGLSLLDLVAADVDALERAAGGVYEDQRLNAVLRGLHPDERQVVFAYAEAEGATWTEAADAAGSSDPEAVGERVRRKVKRLAVEQERRRTQSRGRWLPGG